MKSIDVANMFLGRGKGLEATNLKINKLVYFAQVESLRRFCTPLFEDAIEAWQYGPVEPLVYHALKTHGRAVIEGPVGSVPNDPRTKLVVDAVLDAYGSMSAFDLVTYSHRPGGAWSKVFRRGNGTPITVDDIMGSRDAIDSLTPPSAFSERVREVCDSLPNAMRLLEES